MNNAVLVRENGFVAPVFVSLEVDGDNKQSLLEIKKMLGCENTRLAFFFFIQFLLVCRGEVDKEVVGINHLVSDAVSCNIYGDCLFIGFDYKRNRPCGLGCYVKSLLDVLNSKGVL